MRELHDPYSYSLEQVRELKVELREILPKGCGVQLGIRAVEILGGYALAVRNTRSEVDIDSFIEGNFPGGVFVEITNVDAAKPQKEAPLNQIQACSESYAIRNLLNKSGLGVESVGPRHFADDEGWTIAIHPNGTPPEDIMLQITSHGLGGDHLRVY